MEKSFLDSGIVDPICERLLLLDGDKRVKIQIGKPELGFSNTGEARTDAFCCYKIDGIGSGKTKKIWGIDSVQAIQLAMIVIGCELYASEEAKAGRLKWEAGSVSRDLGFPVSKDLSDLIPFGASAVL